MVETLGVDAKWARRWFACRRKRDAAGASSGGGLTVDAMVVTGVLPTALAGDIAGASAV